MRSTERVLLAIVVLAVLTVTVSGCLGGQNTDPVETPDGYTLAGDVVDARSGDGLPGVSVTVDNRTTETNSSGLFVIENLAEGEYTISAEKSGYLATELSVRVTS